LIGYLESLVSCPPEDEILVFVEGNASPDEVQRVAHHLAECKSCADLVATAAGGVPSDETAAGLAAASARGLGSGTTIGRYVILNLVGRGGMGEVYAAYDPQLDRRVALKLLHHMGSGQSEQVARERLLREAKAIARLSHPNVVVVHDAGAIADSTEGERVFLAMEFVEGRTVAEWLVAEPRSWRDIRDVFLAAGAGLLAAHEAGLVHRDFKPHNVMVTPDRAVRVMDFGLASEGAEGGDDAGIDLDELAQTAGAQTVALTRTGVLIGTPLYMAPEQFLGQRTDARTDQFSFCVALYEALYGERPFASETLPVLADAVTGGRVREPPARARVPPFLWRIIARGLQSDPAKRFPSMRELLDQLRLDPRRRRQIGIAVAATVTLVAGVAAGAQRLATRNERVCRGAPERLAGVWELDGAGPRRASVQRAFLATGAADAAQSWQRVAGALDDYARRWIGLYTDACEATHVRGDQSGEVMDLRMACLDANRGTMGALIDVLARADASVVREALSSAEALPALNRCSDVASLRAAVPPPSSAADRETLSKLRHQLDEAKALADTGQSEAARRPLTGLVAGAMKLGYAPLLAEALRQEAWLQVIWSGPAKALQTYEASIWAALEGRRDDIAIESASVAMGLTGYYLDQPDASARWQHLGWALLKRIGPGHDRQLAYYYHWRSVARQRAGETQAALDDSFKALELTQKVNRPNSLEVIDLLESLAATEVDAGDYAAAVKFADQALEAIRSCCGEHNPKLGHPLSVRGEALARAGKLIEGERDLRRSIELFIEIGGPWKDWTAYPMTALGKDLLAQHRAGEAVPILQRALATREKTEPNAELIAETRFALARALWDVGAERPRAQALAEEALAAYRKLPRHAAQVAEIDRWMASTGKTVPGHPHPRG